MLCPSVLPLQKVCSTAAAAALSPGLRACRAGRSSACRHSPCSGGDVCDGGAERWECVAAASSSRIARNVPAEQTQCRPRAVASWPPSAPPEPAACQQAAPPRTGAPGTRDAHSACRWTPHTVSWVTRRGPHLCANSYRGNAAGEQRQCKEGIQRTTSEQRCLVADPVLFPLLLLDRKEGWLSMQNTMLCGMNSCHPAGADLRASSRSHDTTGSHTKQQASE